MKRASILLAAVVLVVVAVGAANAAVIFDVRADDPATAEYDGDYLKFVASAYRNVSGFTRNYPDGSGESLQGKSPGGEFKFLVTEQHPGSMSDLDDSENYLVTFCAEVNEYIYYDSVYQVTEIITDADEFASWIFWGYTSANEHGNVIPDRVSDPSSTQYMDSKAEARDVQAAIWRALGRNKYSGWIDDGLYSDWETAYGLDVANNVWPLDDGDSGIAVLLREVGGDDLEPAQDQWVFVETGGGDIIPEPASVAIWSLIALTFAAGMGAVRRRRAAAGRGRWSPTSRQAICEMIERGRRG